MPDPNVQGGAYYSAGKGGYVTKKYTPSQARSLYVTLGASERSRLNMYYDKMGKALGFRSQKSFFEAFVDAATNTEYTPWELMSSTMRDAKGLKEAAEKNGRSVGGPFQSTYVNLASESGARKLVDDALGQYLGRRATEDEAAQFYQALLKEQKANPQVTSGYSNGRGSESAVRQEGLDPTQYARDFARSREDYAETQTQTVVKGLITQAIRSANQDWVA
jgi:hypothetical protein